MSQRKQRHSTTRAAPLNRHKRPLLRYLIAGGVLVVAVGAVLAAWSSRNNPPVAVTAEGARLAVDKQEIDFGKVPVEKLVSAIFTVSNVGDQLLQILEEPQVEVVEGCWPPRAVVGSTTLQPGQQTTVTLRFTMHAGMEGPHDFRVHLRTNDATAPETVLIVKSNWVS